LNRLELADTTTSSYRDIVSCIGNQTCRRGVCFSRGLAGAVMDTLIARGPKLDDEVKLTINISGCPSSCGRHQIADIGFTGVMRKIDSHAVPHYVLHLGGHLEVGKTRLGKEVGAIPARNIPSFLVEYLQAFKDSKQYPDFTLFLAAEGEKIAESLTEKYRAVPSYEESPAWYNDFGINE
jgi:sulfite reductase beta subunit-like hemoprotein